MANQFCLILLESTMLLLFSETAYHFAAMVVHSDISVLEIILYLSFNHYSLVFFSLSVFKGSEGLKKRCQGEGKVTCQYFFFPLQSLLLLSYLLVISYHISGLLCWLLVLHRQADMMQDVLRRLEDGSLKPHISQVIPFNTAVGVLNSLDRYSCGKTVVRMDTELVTDDSVDSFF